MNEEISQLMSIAVAIGLMTPVELFNLGADFGDEDWFAVIREIRCISQNDGTEGQKQMIRNYANNAFNSLP